MDDLPTSLVLEILNRVGDSADIARCRVASKTLNSLSRELRFINLHCSFNRYAKSRSSLKRSRITPFKTIFHNLISELGAVQSVAIGVEKLRHSLAYNDAEDEDDLYLSDHNFAREWLPKYGGGLVSCSISDYWVQSCWRRSDVLSLFSSYCRNLVELQIKNAWLSVNALSPMPKLTKLTFECIRLDDEDLSKVNKCFSGLQVLNLIGVGGLKEPKIHLSHLRTCQWVVSNAVHSVRIYAPILVKLRLKCVRPKAIVIEAPLLTDLDLSVEEASNFKVHELVNLTTLHLESFDLHWILCPMPFCKTLKNLKLAPTKSADLTGVTRFGFELLFCLFPEVSSLTLTHCAWSELEKYEYLDVRNEMKGLKEITGYLEIHDFETTLSLIIYILDNCSNLTDMKLLIHRDVAINVTNTLISRCMTHCPRVRWRWGTWKEGTKDAWLPDSE